MAPFLRQSTNGQAVVLGFYVDDTDFKTAETGLSLTVRLFKAGAAGVARHETGAVNHDSDGYYRVPLNATDTNTIGELLVVGKATGALTSHARYVVLPAPVYDSLIAGTGYLPTDSVRWLGQAIAAVDAGGYPKVTLKNGTGPGELDLIGGNVVVNSLAPAAVSTIQSGLATGSQVAALNDLSPTEIAQSVWNAARSSHTAAGSFGQGIASVQGDVTGSVNSVATGVAVSALANGVITAASIATNAVDADALATDAVAELAAAMWTHATRTLSAATNITSTGSPLVLHDDNKALLAATAHPGAVIPTVTGLHPDAYTAIAVQVLSTVVPGSYGAGTVGRRLGDNLDAAVSSVVAALPTPASIRAEIDAALIANRLNELLAAALGSAPEVDSLFDELTEDDGGIRRFSANALEMGPTGAGSSPATIAAEVWNSALANHQAAGSTGEALGQAATGGDAADPWAMTLPGGYTGAQAGKMLSDIRADTDALPPAAAIRSELETAGGKLDLAYGAVTSGTLFAQVAAVKARTDSLPPSPAAAGDIPTAAQIRGELDGHSTRLAAIHQNSTDLIETLGDGGTFHGLVAGIRGKTDALPLDPAASGDIPSAAVVAAAVLGSAVPGALEAGTLGHLVGTRLDAPMSAGHAVLAQVKAQTDLIPAAPLTVGEVEGVLTAMKLDQLLSAAASPPTSGSILGQLLEAPGGVYRFKAPVLALAPAGELTIDSDALAGAVWDAAPAAHNNIGTFGAKVGGITPLTIPQVQDAVWLAGPDSHGQQPGTFGWMLDARVSGLLPNSAGTGAVAFVYSVTNGINQQPLPEVVVTVSTDSQGQAVVARARTAMDGTCTFHLNPGVYYFWRAKSGWAFVNPDVETVTQMG